MANLTINTSFGSIEVTYSAREELELILKTLPEDIEFIENSIGTVQSKTQREPKVGFESAYRFVNNMVELLIPFPEGTKAVAITLFAYNPIMVSSKDIQAITGIENFKSKVVGQTNNKGYFRQDGDKYGLSDAGIKYVFDEIKPKLPVKKEPEIN